jgi:hypothetical protein
MSKHKWEAPRRVEILAPSGAGYFKKGQYAYVIASNTAGGFHWVDRGGSSEPGQRVYLVTKSKHGRGGALWYSPEGVRFTGHKKKQTRTRGSR